MIKKWMSEVTVCELCGKPYGKHFYDANVGVGWALVCETCFKSHGGSLGIGRGQKYVTKTRIGVDGFKE